MSLPVPERIAKLRDPEVRRFLNERAQSPDAGVFTRLTDWGRYQIGDTYSAANEGLKGRVVGDIARERGTSGFDTLLDIVIADDLRTVLWPLPTDDDAASWALRKEAWDDPRVMIGGSDAGAHLDRMCGAPYTTGFLARLPARPPARVARACGAADHVGAGAPVRAARPRRACARARTPTSSCSTPPRSPPATSGWSTTCPAARRACTRTRWACSGCS